MKKRSLKKLSLNKHTISNFETSQIKAGSGGDVDDTGDIDRTSPTVDCSPSDDCISTEWYCFLSTIISL